MKRTVLLTALVLALAVSDAAAQEQRGSAGASSSSSSNVTVNIDQGRRGGGGGDRWRGGGGGGGGPRYGHYYHQQPRGFDPSAAIGGAIGGWLYRQWATPAEPVRDVAWCMNRYRSYDPYTRTYLGYDGLRHGCP